MFPRQEKAAENAKTPNGVDRQVCIATQACLECTCSRKAGDNVFPEKGNQPVTVGTDHHVLFQNTATGGVQGARDQSHYT